MEKINVSFVQSDFTKKREEALIKIKSSHLFDDFILKYEITDQEIINNASKFLKVMEENECCKNCKSIFSCKMANKGVNYFLGFDSKGEIALKLEPCNKNSLIVLNKYFIYRDFEDNIADYSIKSLASPDYVYPRKKVIASFVDILKNNSRKGIYLYGSRQCGKSFMLSVFSKVYAEKNDTKAAFINASKHFKMLNEAYFLNKDNFNSLLNDLIEVDLLVIDDFGNEYKNEIIRDMIVFPLLNERLKKNKLTSFTSSYSLNEIQSMYALKENASPKARQLIEIIELLTNVINIVSAPYRE